MDDKHLAILYKTLSKTNSPNFKALKKSLGDMGADIDEDTIEGIFNMIKDGASLDEILELSPGNKKTNKSFSSKEEVELAREKGNIKRKQLDAELIVQAKALNFHTYITDYKVIGGKTRDELTKRVKENMRKGWVPFGGTSGAYPQGAGLITTPDKHFQAMVRFNYK